MRLTSFIPNGGLNEVRNLLSLILKLNKVITDPSKNPLIVFKDFLLFDQLYRSLSEFFCHFRLVFSDLQQTIDIFTRLVNCGSGIGLYKWGFGGLDVECHAGLDLVISVIDYLKSQNVNPHFLYFYAQFPVLALCNTFWQRCEFPLHRFNCVLDEKLYLLLTIFLKN